MALSLITLNIERDLHLDVVESFLKEQLPDVACIQELFEADIPRIEAALGATCFFAPAMRSISHSRGRLVEGTAIFSRLPFRFSQSYQYGGVPTDVVDYIDGTAEEKQATSRDMLLVAEVEKDGELFRIATVHFPWTPDGEANDMQREALPKLLTITDRFDDIVLCGDFNAPRGKEIFSLLSEHFTDNVPSQYETSIDGNLHRAGPLPLMVDGMFSTSGYRVSEVEMICGVSDHCALLAKVER